MVLTQEELDKVMGQFDRFEWTAAFYRDTSNPDADNRIANIIGDDEATQVLYLQGRQAAPETPPVWEIINAGSEIATAMVATLVTLLPVEDVRDEDALLHSPGTH